ncbi:unnamed protein product [Pleuronectes platessa]|uniref:Uncharacterized protein n=1 Tax=Pleuronectes platessa TaxID=8262 RepID=A0A9N7V495_PLEPL|nr:unnamed protein product [Pleuronectes platessa]
MQGHSAPLSASNPVCPGEIEGSGRLQRTRGAANTITGLSQTLNGALRFTYAIPFAPSAAYGDEPGKSDPGFALSSGDLHEALNDVGDPPVREQRLSESSIYLSLVGLALNQGWPSSQQTS